MEAQRSAISPFCAKLRSKKTYFLAGPPRTEEDVLDASGRTWCTHTMDAIGPDGRLVRPAACQAGRGCFEPLGPTLGSPSFLT
jgi:hypothetical protein